jgi:hypothetical protein
VCSTPRPAFRHLADGTPVPTLDPNNIDLSGDATLWFQAAKAPFSNEDSANVARNQY